jgi:hypothetical protein
LIQNLLRKKGPLKSDIFLENEGEDLFWDIAAYSLVEIDKRFKRQTSTLCKKP